MTNAWPRFRSSCRHLLRTRHEHLGPAGERRAMRAGCAFVAEHSSSVGPSGRVPSGHCDRPAPGGRHDPDVASLAWRWRAGGSKRIVAACGIAISNSPRCGCACIGSGPELPEPGNLRDQRPGRRGQGQVRPIRPSLLSRQSRSREPALHGRARANGLACAGLARSTSLVDAVVETRFRFPARIVVPRGTSAL